MKKVEYAQARNDNSYASSLFLIIINNGLLLQDDCIGVYVPGCKGGMFFFLYYIIRMLP